MSIDFRKYYADHCFGAMSCSDEHYGADFMGDDIDEELEASIDDELFGATGDGKARRLKMNFSKLQKMHAVGSRMKRRNRRGHALEVLKQRMRVTMYKIASIWRTMETSAKKEWAKEHKGSARNPATFIKKYGPHHF